MKISDIRGEDTQELLLAIQAVRKEAFDLSFRSSGEDVTNPSRHQQIRRTIARIKTVLQQREAVAKASAEAASTGKSSEKQS